MTTFPNSPKLLKGGIALLNPTTGTLLPNSIISLQYNPDTISRTLQVQGAGGEGGDRSEALRIKGPPVETIKLKAEIDATDQLETGDGTAVELGLHPQLARLELLIYPTTRQLQSNNSMARSGQLEILPMEAPLTLFVWSKQRTTPVRITELSITEDAFDTSLNPIRAKISLELRVLSVDDLGFSHKGGTAFMSYLQNKEQLAGRIAGGNPDTIGFSGV